MRALSLWQPWAFAVTHLGKRIENRTAWKGCNVRGPFLIHASKGSGTQEDFNGALETITRIVGDDHPSWGPGIYLPRGGIVGAAIVDGVIANEADFAAYAANRAEVQRAWWFGGFALVLRDVIPLPFRPWKGKQGWFDVPADPVMGTGGRLLGVTWREP
jgi:hypothetical protein